MNKIGVMGVGRIDVTEGLELLSYEENVFGQGWILGLIGDYLCFEMNTMN